MDINKVKRNKKELRSVMIAVRTFPSYSEWMKKHEVSPSKLFNLSLEELMKKTK